MQKTITTNEIAPKTTMRLSSLKNDFKKIKKVTCFIEVVCEVASSIITIPINGKIKKIIPKIGVT
jgi:hypothetical protein